MRWGRALAVAGCVGAAAAMGAIVIGGASGGGRPPVRSRTRAWTTRASGRPIRGGWELHTGPLPILEYHAIQPPPPGSAYPRLFVPQADFTAQMGWLAHHGYEGVTLDQVEKAWYRGGKLPPKPIVVTFDDGYRSQYVAAVPELERLGWPGVLDLKAAGSDLPDDEARKMIVAGWELASHTINHLDLTTLDAAQLWHEVAGSRRILQRRFGVPVHDFCYPAGRYDDAAIAALRTAGYRAATTENFGLGSRAHPYVLDRIEIELDDHLTGFVEKLRAAGA